MACDILDHESFMKEIIELFHEVVINGHVKR